MVPRKSGHLRVPPRPRVLLAAVPLRGHRRYHRVRIAAEQVGADQQHQVAAGRVIRRVIAEVALRDRRCRSSECPATGSAPEIPEVGRRAPDRKLAPQQFARQRLVEPDHETLRRSAGWSAAAPRRSSAPSSTPGSIQAGERSASAEYIGLRKLRSRRSAAAAGPVPVPSGMRAPNRAAIVSSGSSRACNAVRAGRQCRRSAERRRIGRAAPAPCSGSR